VPDKGGFVPLLERLAWKFIVVLSVVLVVVQVLLVIPGVRDQLSVVERLEGRPVSGMINNLIHN